MSPELIHAIQERIKAGWPKEQIKAEVVATGYSEEDFEVIYDLAFNNLNEAKVVVSVANKEGSQTLISYSDFISATFHLAFSQLGTFLKVFGIGGILSVVLIGLVFILVGGSANLEITGNLTYFFFITAFLVFFCLTLQAFLVLIRSILRRKYHESLISHLIWSLKHSWGLLLISIGSISIIFSGFLFFLVPGFILLVYLCFTFFFYADDKGKSIQAMTMSTAYVYGRFWPVLGRLMLLSVLVYILVMLASLVSFATVFLAPFFIALFVMASYHLTFCGHIVLYESLQASGVVKPLPLKESTLTAIFKVISYISLLASVGFLVLGLTFLSFTF